MRRGQETEQLRQFFQNNDDVDRSRWFARSGHDFDFAKPLAQSPPPVDHANRRQLVLPAIPESQAYLAALPKPERRALRAYLNGAPSRPGKLRPSTADITGRGMSGLERPESDRVAIQEMLPKVTRRMRRAISNAPLLQKDLVVYRGSAVGARRDEDPLSKMPAYDEPAFISTSLAFDVAEHFSNMATYQLAARTAREKGGARPMQTWQAIRLPAGTPFLHFPKNNPNRFAEQEVLLYGSLEPDLVVEHPDEYALLEFSTYVPAPPPAERSSEEARSPQSESSPLVPDAAWSYITHADDEEEFLLHRPATVVAQRHSSRY